MKLPIIVQSIVHAHDQFCPIILPSFFLVTHSFNYLANSTSPSFFPFSLAPPGVSLPLVSTAVFAFQRPAQERHPLDRPHRSFVFAARFQTVDRTGRAWSARL